VTHNEGDSGTTAYAFTVSLSAPSGKAISVGYATADGTAVAPTDYTATTGTLNFAAGDTSKPVTVNAKGDTAVEPDETFVVNLSSLTNVGAGDVQGQGTIVNDDVAVAPIVTGYNVAAATVGKKITITGSHFTGATSVGFTKAGGGTVNGTALKVVSDTTITVKVPNLATTGVVSVTNPGGTGVGPVLKIKSTITGFTPTHGTSGVTGPVTITGNAFTGATKVKFGTKTAVFTVDNDGQITVTKVPSGLASGSDVFITVTTAGGNGKSKTTFHID
jgi:Calx-beta domain/IPT/TIG domain